MYDYLKGNIVKQFTNFIVLDVNGIGYKIFTPNPYAFKVLDNVKVYVYTHIREDENTLYGFSTEDERDLFLRLIDVKGLGPKMGISILASCSINGLVDAIDRENVLYLKKVPKVGEKLASVEETKDNSNELVLALEALGYKATDIKAVVPKIDNELNIEMQIKEALKLLLK